MQRLDSSATQVLQCGGVLTYQLLCGRELAKDDQMATQMANYCYLIVNSHDRTAIAVDAAWDVDGLYRLAAELGVAIRGSIYTHCHFDHCGGELPPFMTQGRKVVKAGAKEVEEQGGHVWAGQGDAEYMRGQCRLKQIATVHDGDVIDCGDLVLHILHTPGHTPGSICIFAAPRCISPRDALGASPFQETLTKAEGGLLITGDTLFVGSCGRTDLPGSDQQQMFGSLSRLAKLDPSVVVLPGHNYADLPFTTIGSERSRNQMVRMGLQQVPSPPPLPPCAACDNRGACGPKGFIIGRKVRIKGLTSESGQILNGQPAVIQTFATDKERYAVRLFAASEVKSLKPENLETLAPGEKCDAPIAETRDAAPPPTPQEFVNAALALLENASPADIDEWAKMSGSLDWGMHDSRWFLLKSKLLNDGSVRAAFGDALEETIELLRREFDPKWQRVVLHSAL